MPDHSHEESASRRAGAAGGEFWSAVDRLLDRMSADAVRVQGVGPLSALRWRVLGQVVPADIAHEERATRTAMMILPALLGRIREAYSGRVLVFKGPEVASRYPGSARSFRDLDLLAEDAQAAQDALIAAGFVEQPDPTNHFHGIHHLAPLVYPTLPLTIEIHDVPKWPRGAAPPQPAELFEAAVPSWSGVDGIEAPAPHHHALLVAAHGWGHSPLRSLRDLLDAEAVAAGADLADIEATARAWRVDRMWATTHGAASWLFRGTRRPVAVSLWARHLIQLREATVMEGHVERWLSPFWLLPARQALPLSARRFADDFRSPPDTSWGEKARSITRASRHAFMTKSEHGWVNEDAPPSAEPVSPTRD